MKFALAAGVAAAALAFSALTFSALADEPTRPDANGDGWITRAEASAMADHAFQEMDSNHDGKLDASDHSNDHGGFHHSRHGDHDGDDHDHTDSGAPDGSHGHHMHGPPGMMMMGMGANSEADTNGDHALSLAEFRAQHLRFFDASDVNGDGRIQFERPPEPPAPPNAPQPPR